MTRALQRKQKINYDNIADLPLNRIHPDPNQPRKFFSQDSIDELACSISVHGLLQPILVRPWNGDYQIVHGERRYRACLKLNLQTIKAFIKELSNEQVRDIQLVENVERDNLSDIELAWEFQRRVNQGQTHKQIGEVIGKTKAYVTQRLALLKLPKTEQERMLKGTLSFSNARQLLSIKDTALRNKISRQITSETTVMQTVTLIHTEAVTRVTDYEPVDQIDVKKLAVYQLIINRNHVVASELLSALAQDLKLLRGE